MLGLVTRIAYRATARRGRSDDTRLAWKIAPARSRRCERFHRPCRFAERCCERLTFFHSAATCLHLPARLTRESLQHEGRKPRASERHVVGCCEVLAAARWQERSTPFPKARREWGNLMVARWIPLTNQYLNQANGDDLAKASSRE